MSSRMRDETKRARSAVAVTDGHEIRLDVTTDDGQLFSFILMHPEVTLDSLAHALSQRRVAPGGGRPS